MVINRQRAIRVSSASLARFLRQVRKSLALGARGCTVCLVTDAEMARLNETYRGKKGPTDVLSFPAQVTPVARPEASESLRSASAAANFSSPRRRNDRNGERKSAAEYLGDIAISPATARRNARLFSRNLGEELKILVLHGVLHLLGYDHEEDDGTMERLENRLRRRLGLEAGTLRARRGRLAVPASLNRQCVKGRNVSD